MSKSNTQPTTSDSSLNPSAPTFTMPTTDPPAASTSAQPKSPNTMTNPDETTNGQPKDPKGKRPEAKTTTTAENIAEAGAGVKLTGAALKKQKLAEKAARRAGRVAERGATAQSGPQQPGPVQAREDQMASGSNAGGGAGGEASSGQHRRSGSTTVRIPIRSAQSQQQQGQQGQGDRAVSNATKDKTLDKRVPMLGHLYTASSGHGKRASLATADRQIHPAVLTLGLQLRDYVICGSNARTVATLLVFKKVIRSYDTPSGVALSRDLTRHLSHQISYLSHARPLCVGQGNSIRWLKKLITALDPDMADTDAKAFLCKAIDMFIREKITLADEVIATQANTRIEDDGEVILTYGKSSVVEKTLITAFEAGKKFKVIVADSRPLFEGKNLVRNLVRRGFKDVQYCLLSGLADAVEQEGVTKCLLGASAMLGNGRLSSRAGTAMVAMMAKESGGAHGKAKVPVIVLCESLKFTAKVALDSFATNELANPDILVESEHPQTLLDSLPPPTKPEPQKKSAKPADESAESKEKKGLEGWRDKPNLFLVNLMYDVTPMEYLDVVVSELGSLPPNAVPVVNGVHGDDE